ncbi:MAG: divalent-cation tolerance protein CutA [Nitrospinaceae bacterium]|nr:divalent-cation tolerance protein CutA [Nitrospinaceae bacterium]MBT3435568.1 divalent-cation tolerance protein CutA [Nitrospinaceae bacterium]MBT4095579.1 divalent-cation tolerance protein CutA [Nitrospinaceae bacterium]MBT4430213.1 divalent-cation tolerance protein CutA [Nitrospinaceae bacterium]MBT5946081.1 divalent-cation tolerance protein CutA [Nitrospinaceae bacterium]
MKDAGGLRVVMVTAGSEKEAAKVARALVDERLAACVNIVPGVRSIYRWQETIEDEREVLMVIKTGAASLDALEARVRELHSYDVPEIIAMPFDKGSGPYLEWLAESLGK